MKLKLILLVLFGLACNSSEVKDFFPELRSGEYFSELSQVDGGKQGYLILKVDQSNYQLRLFLDALGQEINISKQIVPGEKSLLAFTEKDKLVELAASLNLVGNLKYQSQVYQFNLKSFNFESGKQEVAPSKELKEVMALTANYLELKDKSPAASKDALESSVVEYSALVIPEDLTEAIRDLSQEIFSLQVKLEKQGKALSRNLADVNRRLMQEESKLLLSQLDIDEVQLEDEKRSLLTEISAISDDIYILKHQLGGDL